MTKNVCLLMLVMAVAAPVAADSLNCRLVGTFDTPGSAWAVAVSGNYAYVADYDSGLRIVNVSNPQSPYEAGFCATPGVAFGVAVSGSFAYVADVDSGLRIINVANPQSPYEAGFYDTPGMVRGVAVSGNYACVADGAAGLRIIEYYGVGVEEAMNDERGAMNSGPTIVHGVLFLDGDCPRAGTVPKAALLDISGRKVLDLHPGANAVSRLAPGVYFVRNEETRRVLLVP